MINIATVTSLGFNITAKWDGAGLRTAQAQLDSLKKSLNAIDGQSLRIAVDVDDSAARTKLTALRSLVSNQTMTVNVNADTSAASARISALQAQVDHLGATRVTATATVNANAGNLDALQARLNLFGAQRYVAQADVNTDRAHAGLLGLQRDADDSTTHLRLLGGAGGDAGAALTGMGGAAGGASSGVSGVGSSASGAGASMGGLATATGIATIALMAIGPVAALASAAVLGTLGVAFVGVGALALSQTAVVKEAFTGLKNSVMSDALQAAQGMKAPLLQGIAELQAGIHGLVPVFSQAFSAAGQLIKPMVDSFLNFANTVMPGVVVALRAAQPVFDGLKTGMSALGAGMSTMFTGMAAGAKGAGAALSTVLGGIGKILGIVGVAFGQMAGAGSRALTGLMTGLVSLTSGAMAGFVQGVKIMDGTLGPFLAQLGKFTGQILQGLLPALASLLTALMTGLTPVMKALGPVFIVVGQAVAKLGLALAPLMGALGQLVAQVITALMPAFIQVVDIWARAGAQLLTALLPALIKLTPSVILVVQAVVKLALAFLPLMPLLVQLDLLFIKLLIACLPIITVLLQIAAVIIGAFATAITFIVGLITNFGTTWSTVVHGLSIVWNAVSGALVVAWNAVWTGMTIAAGAIWTGMTTAWSAVVQGFSLVWTTVSGALVIAWNAVWNGMTIAAQAIWTGMTAAWNGVVQGFSTVWTTVSSALVAAWGAVWNGMATTAQAIWTTLTAAWSTFINTMATIWNTVSAGLKAAWEAIWTAVKGFAISTWGAIQAAWSTFVNALVSIWNTVGNALKVAWEAIWTAVKGFAISTWNVIQGAWQTFVNALKSIWNTAGATLKAAWEAIWTAVKGFAISTWNVIQGSWQTFVNALKTIWNTGSGIIKKAWQDTWNAVKTTAHDIWTSIVKVIDGGVNAAIDVVNGIIKAWDAVVGAVGLKTLNIKAIGHVKAPSFADGGMVVPLTYSDGGFVPGFHKGGLTFAATHNQRSGSSSFGDLRQGGALPGYQPGKDSVPAILSPGEGVLVPEAVRGLGGPNFVHAANNHYSNGRGGKSFAGGTGGFGFPGFATGGVVGSVAGSVSNLGSALVNFAVGGTTVPGPGIANPNNPSANQQKQGAANGTAGVTGNKVKSTTSDSISEIISKALGLVIPGAGDDGSTVSNIVKGIAHAALGFLGGGATGTILGFIGEKAINAGFSILGKFADSTLKGKFGNVGDVMDAGSHKIIDGLRDYLINQDKQKAKEFAAQAVAGSQSVQAWAPMMAAALQIAGAPASWLGGMLALMQAESGGNPNIFNTTDSNARAGTPSGGLMQVIGPTFAAYCQPGYCSNLLDPMSNMLASINYIQARYGHVPGSPYATGTTNATPGAHLVGENGPEMVMFGGGETVKTATDTSAMLKDGAAPTTPAAGAAASGGIDLPAQKLAANAALWKTYMTQIRTTSDTAWNGVKTTADSSWSTMQAKVVPFAGTLVKTISAAGNSIVGDSKTTWTNTRNLAVASWADEKSNSTAFTTGLQKSFSDTGTAIQAKWKNDWSANEATTTKAWVDQKAGAAAFGTDLQKTYADTSEALQTGWKNSLTASSLDTTKYWTDTKAQYTQGTANMQTGFIAPVTTMLDTDLPAAFNASVTAIAAGWEGLKTTVRDPVAAVVDVVFNQGIVAMWNAIAGTFDTPTLNTFTMPGFAVGGAVQGAGTGTSDSITARLSHGEHVWTAAEVAGAGGHGNVAALRQAAVGGSPVKGAGMSSFATGGAVVGAPQGGSSAATTVPTTGADALTAAAGAALGSISPISNPFIEAAGAAGKDAIAALLPDDVPYKTLLNNMTDQMVGTVTSWISANDVAPVFSGGANVAAAQAWADSQVGKPYGLGGDFVNTIDCSEFQSGIARVILGETPAPWFTTFAFVGDTAPEGFQQGLEAPYMVGITNVGVGHMAGTINGKNYEATPPAVRSGPSARGYNDPMFTNQYGFAPSIATAVGAAVSDSNHLAIIDAAMAAAGVPPPDTQAAWESGMNLIITNESAWDPNAINNYDINAQNGVPSQGLAQVIPPTFSAYHVAGTSTNILDPIANVAAAINYIRSVYGSINSVPGVASVNAGGGYLPYYAGTRGAQAGWHTVGERGPEWVKFRGGEEVLPNGQLPPSNGGNGDVHLSIPITVQGNMDSDVYKRVENELVPKIRMMLQQRRGR